MFAMLKNFSQYCIVIQFSLMFPVIFVSNFCFVVKQFYIQGVRKRLYLFKKFCCFLGAILKILCPRERRVFKSKLGVSSSNQCNLHHSPHTGHLEKKKKWFNLFRTPCIIGLHWAALGFLAVAPLFCVVRWIRGNGC